MSQQPVAGAVPPIKVRQGTEITLVGEADALANALASELEGVADAEGVVYVGLAVLRAARGKDLRVIDPRTGASETLGIWKS